MSRLFTKQRFGLFFSMPLSPQDWTNLNTSRVKLVMLPFRLAYKDVALTAHMASLGIKLVLRIDEEEMHTYSPQAYKRELQFMQKAVQVDAVILGNEPEGWHDLTYKSNARGWGIDDGTARRHALRMDAVRVALTGLGVQLVSPGWTAGRKTEIDTLRPGRQAWRIEVGQEYALCDGNGGHLYLFKWDEWADEYRFLYQASELAEMFHRPLWLDEAGVIRGDDMWQMAAYIRQANMLLDTQWEVGARTAFYCPFVSNGDPYVRDAQGNILLDDQGRQRVHWPPEYLITDPRAYQLLGTFMGGN